VAVPRQYTIAAFGAAVALALALPLAATGVRAQTAEGIGGRPWPAARAVADQLRRLPPSEQSTDAAIDLPVHETAAEPVRDEDAEADEDGSAQVMLGRTPVVDGATTGGEEPTAAIDGKVEAVEPGEPGEETALRRDVRSGEDIAAFERPRAGYDVEAFSIEPEPLADRRPGRLFRRDAYEPIGVRIGSFIVYPEVEVGIAGFSNVFHTSGNPRDDVALDLRPAVRAVSTWSTHAFELRASGTTSFHDEYHSENDKAGLLEARGRLDITRRTNIEALASWELSQEGRGSINEPSAAVERTDVETLRAAVAVNHRFNRLSVQLRGSIADVDYAPVRLASGTLFRNDDRDMVQREAAVRVAWLLKPGFSVFGETSVNARDHSVLPSDGITRDSAGNRERVGVSFGNYDSILRGEASIGYGRQDFDAPSLPDVDGLLVDANVAWRMSALTSLLFTARSDVTEAIVAGTGGALSRSVGVELRHAFLRQLIASTGIRYTRQDYQGISLTERELVALLGIEYHLSRELMLYGRYQHIEFDSTDLSRNYNADEIRVGIRVAR